MNSRHSVFSYTLLFVVFMLGVASAEAQDAVPASSTDAGRVRLGVEAFATMELVTGSIAPIEGMFNEEPFMGRGSGLYYGAVVDVPMMRGSGLRVSVGHQQVRYSARFDAMPIASEITRSLLNSTTLWTVSLDMNVELTSTCVAVASRFDLLENLALSAGGSMNIVHERNVSIPALTLNGDTTITLEEAELELNLPQLPVLALEVGVHYTIPVGADLAITPSVIYGFAPDFLGNGSLFKEKLLEDVAVQESQRHNLRIGVMLTAPL